VGRGSDRELGDLLTGGGVHVAPGGLVGCRDPVSADQHAAVAEAELVAVRLDGCDHGPAPLGRTRSSYFGAYTGRGGAARIASTAGPARLAGPGGVHEGRCRSSSRQNPPAKGRPP